MTPKINVQPRIGDEIGGQFLYRGFEKKCHSDPPFLTKLLCQSRIGGCAIRAQPPTSAREFPIPWRQSTPTHPTSLPAGRRPAGCRYSPTPTPTGLRLQAYGCRPTASGLKSVPAAMPPWACSAVQTKVSEFVDVRAPPVRCVGGTPTSSGEGA